MDDGGNVYLSGLSINDNDPANGGKGILDFPVEDDPWVLKLEDKGNDAELIWSTKITAPVIDTKLPAQIQGGGSNRHSLL